MIVQARNLVKRFGALKAVDGLSVDLKANETLAIVGESGCGKTTVAKIIAGLIQPDAGDVALTAKVQMVFQDPNSSLDPFFTIGSTLNEAFYRQKELTKAQQQQQIRDIFNAVGLEFGMLGRYPHEFSGGQRQRIAIARALLANPRVLVLDEVTSSLDVLIQKQILDLLREIKARFGLSYIFISHNLRVVRRFADTIMVMKEGKVVEMGTSSDVINAPRQAYTRELLAAAFL